MHLYEKRGPFAYRGLCVTLALLTVMLVLFSTAMGAVGEKTQTEQAALLREALVRAAVSCYAIEGRYPPTLDYLTRVYGVVVDDARFLVHYDAFAQNVMPAITVLTIGGRLS